IVNVLIVHSATPDYRAAAATIRTDGGSADIHSKQQRTVIVGIDTKYIAAFGAADQNAFSVWQGLQNGRVADVHIRTHRGGTGLPFHRAVAAAHENIVFGRLVSPKDLAGVDVHRHNAIGCFRSRGCGGIASPEIDRIANGIYRW